MAYNPRIQVTPLPPSNNIERLQEIQRLTADPKESLTDPIKAAQLIKYYSPQTLRAQAQQAQNVAAAQASRGQAPVPTRPQMDVPVPPQPRRVFSEEGERMLTAQEGGLPTIARKFMGGLSRKSGIAQPQSATTTSRFAPAGGGGSGLFGRGLPPEIMRLLRKYAQENKDTKNIGGPFAIGSPEFEKFTGYKVARQGGGRAAIPQQIENVASRGRHGDTMLMHVNPQELRGLSSLLGPTTINPDTGLPEAFLWWLPLIGAAIGGIATKSWKGAALGGLAGLGGAFMMPAAAGSAASQAALAAGAAGQGGTALTQGALAAQLANPALATGLAPAGTMFGAAAPTYAGSLAGAGGSLVPAATHAGILSGAAAPITAAGQGLTAGTPGWNIQNWGNLAEATRAAQGLPSTASQVGAFPQGAAQGASFLSGPAPTTQLAGTVPKQTNWLQQVLKSITGSGGDTTIQGGAKEDLLETATKDTAKEAGLLSKFKSLSPLKRAAIVGGGSSLLGLLAQPKETDFGFQLPIKKVSEFDLSGYPTPEARKPKELTQKEIEERIFAGNFPEEKESYFEEADVFAKKGGVISRQAGGGAWTGSGYVGAKPPPSGFTYVPGMGPMGGSKLMTVEDAGGLYTTQGGIYGAPGFTPASQLGRKKVGPAPFEFPDVDPFQSGLSSFNVEDRLSRILGSSAVPQQFTLPSTPTTLPAIPASMPSANLQQGPSAMESLFSRFQQTQGDPIVDIVSESVTPSQQGGLIALQSGGSSANQGRFEDNALMGGQVAHISAAEAELLKRMGGAGTTNPATGLPEYYSMTAAYGPGGKSYSGASTSGGYGGPGPGTGPGSGAAAKSKTKTKTINTGPPVVSRSGPLEGTGGEQTVTLTQATPTPTVQSAPLGERGKALAKSLNSIVSGYEGLQSNLGVFGKLATPVAIQALFGEGSPVGLAGFAKALTNTGGYSPSTGPSLGTEDPYHVPNPILGEGPMATGASPFISQGGMVGLANGGNPVFAGHLQGMGDGMSDQIPFRVVPQTPQDIPNAPDMAVLSTDEYVFPADAVSMLGNGSSNAGAKILDDAVKRVRQASIGTPKQIKEIDGTNVLTGALTT